MKKQHYSLTSNGFPLARLAFRVWDALSIIGALQIAMALTDRVIAEGAVTTLLIVTVLLFLALGTALGLYELGPTDTDVLVAVRVGTAWIGTLLILSLLGFLFKVNTDYSRVALATWMLLAPLAMALIRYLGRGWFLSHKPAGGQQHSLAIVGLTPQGLLVRDRINQSGWRGIKFLGFFDDRVAKRDDATSTRQFHGDMAQCRGRLDDLVALARGGQLDYVCIALPMKAEHRIVQLVNELADTTASVYFVPNFFIFDLMKFKMGSLDGVPLFSIQEPPLEKLQAAMKRAEDIVFGSAILLLIAIPMVFLAMAVKITSPGPVLFKQRRYGLNGAIVEVWKFRSMTVCEDGDVIRQATKSDTRITPLGRFMRRTSLDELPQFLNVLQGSMSIVGPRPHAVAHNEQYRKLVRGYMLRHKMKPGITGLAQVSGWRGETETLEHMEKRVEHDLKYMNEWTIWLDIKIILLTVVRGFVGSKAY